MRKKKKCSAAENTPSGFHTSPKLEKPVATESLTTLTSSNAAMERYDYF